MYLALLLLLLVLVGQYEINNLAVKAGMSTNRIFVYLLGVWVFAVFINADLIWIGLILAGMLVGTIRIEGNRQTKAGAFWGGGRSAGRTAEAAPGGRYAGDKAAASDRITLGRLQPDFSPIVRAAGRFITVTLPDNIDDIEGYDPVEAETKKALAGRSIDFPRGLTLDELQSQLVARLKEEYDIGYVDSDLTADGTVEYLAVGQRAAGLGPTLPPKSAAVAVQSDPPFSATPGDTVQVWRADGESGEGEERLGTAELRASVGRVATVAMDETAADRIDPVVEHRLMTLSADQHPDREFAAMLRRGDETMSVIEITAESPLVGNSVGALNVTIIAVRATGGEVETIPKRDRLIQVGDSLFAIGRPETLRKLESSKGAETTESDDAVRNAAAGAILFSLGTDVDSERRADGEDWTDYGDDDVSE
jgi:hypothetical protein